jgi:5-methylthioadenosine/S-adenosylhomocysteine deaminase
MWSVAKLTGLIHNITGFDYEHWPSLRGTGLPDRRRRARDAAAAADRTDHARLSGRPDLLDLDTLAFTPLNDLRRQLVYCENGSSVRMTHGGR